MNPVLLKAYKSKGPRNPDGLSSPLFIEYRGDLWRISGRPTKAMRVGKADVVMKFLGHNLEEIDPTLYQWAAAIVLRYEE